MIRKILKWIGLVLGSITGLLVLAFTILSIIGGVEFNKDHQIPKMEETCQ